MVGCRIEPKKNVRPTLWSGWGVWPPLWPDKSTANLRPSRYGQPMVGWATAGSNVWPGLWPATLYADNSCSHHIIYFYYHYCSTFLTIPLISHEYLCPPYVLCISVHPSYYYSIFLSTKKCVYSSVTLQHIIYHLCTTSLPSSEARYYHSNPSLGVIRSSIIPQRSISVALKALYAACLWSISLEIILVSIYNIDLDRNAKECAVANSDLP